MTTTYSRIQNSVFALRDAHGEAYAQLVMPCGMPTAFQTALGDDDESDAYWESADAKDMLGEIESALLDAYIGHYDVSKIDVAAAVYWWLSENYSGQGSAEYAALCAIGQVYKPGYSERGNDSDIFNELDDDHAIALAYAIAGEG